MASTEDLARLSWEVYDGTVPYGWSRLTDSRDFPDIANVAPGFYAAVYQNIETQEVVIAYKGTALTDTGDLAASLAIVSAGEHPQFVAALRFAHAIRDLYASTAPAITVTGHSLGRCLAQLAADVFGWGGTTFEAPGIAQVKTGVAANQFDQFFAETGASFGHVPDDGSFTNLTVAGSLFSRVGEHIGQRSTPIEVEEGSLNFIELMVAWGLSGGTAVPMLLAVRDQYERHYIGNTYKKLQRDSDQGRLLESLTQQFLVDGVEGYHYKLSGNFSTYLQSLFNDTPPLSVAEVGVLIGKMEGLLANSPLFNGNHTSAQLDLINALDQVKMSVQTLTITPPANLSQWTEASGPNQSIEFVVTLDQELRRQDQQVVVSLPGVTLSDYGEVVGGISQFWVQDASTWMRTAAAMSCS